MSTEVTPESLRSHATWMNDRGAKESHMALTRWADDLEREQRPLPTVPGWYPTIVVERGGESCTGALLADDESWQTALCVGDHHTHYPHSGGVTIRWAEQDGTTPGQTLWEADSSNGGPETWPWLSLEAKDYWERVAAAVLAAHGTPTLTPVGEHPEPGTRGLLPVGLDDGEWGSSELGCSFASMGAQSAGPSSLTLARTVRMSDVLSPAEQARAARWAANWLATEAYVGGTAIVELHQYADTLDPPETVESLRAERDEAREGRRLWHEQADIDRAEHELTREKLAAHQQVKAERDAAASDVAYWREQFRLVCDESEDHKKQADEARARLRDVLAAAAAHAHAEAARGRCSRED